MPQQFLSQESEEPLAPEQPDEPSTQKSSRKGSLLRSLGARWRKPRGLQEADPELSTSSIDPQPLEDHLQRPRASQPNNNGPFSQAIASLPRPQDLSRQESEQREKLLKVPPSMNESRTASLNRKRGLSASAARRALSPKSPLVLSPFASRTGYPGEVHSDRDHGNGADGNNPDPPPLSPLPIPDRSREEVESINNDEDDDAKKAHLLLLHEHTERWVLNLSMHFRDNSKREKFFVTYAETATKWRRLTISLDYRNAPEGSLEEDVSCLKFQRDKSFRIYEAIRESLDDIHFYNTVTNLRLVTTPEDGQLHVHVREDVNEIVEYPSLSLLKHVRVPLYRESDVEFVSHLSGFVYEVNVDGDHLIKKEIPGPDTIDEFLYEVNALDALFDSENVIKLRGLVTDETGTVVKGLLISYATHGALVDVIFADQGTPVLPWHRREKWAKQIVQGLSDIHEAGFVQGDFTLSNVVIDGDDNAQIIDINRRGCPVGWEPPELHRLIQSGQRISMCIGVKTDLFQLGMVLWALAQQIDDPDLQERPLARLPQFIPSYFRDIVETCLSERPQDRWSARILLDEFPTSPSRPSVGFIDDPVRNSDHSPTTCRSDREYIDPAMAVTLEDVNGRRRGRAGAYLSPVSSGQVQYVVDPQDPDSNAASSNYHFGSSGSWVLAHRDRSRVSSRRGRNSPFARTASISSGSATSLSRSPPSRGRRRRGSECSFDNRGLERKTSANGNGLGIDIGRRATTGEREKRDEGDAPLPNGVARLAGENDVHSGLMHTDSGFDEHMDREFNAEPWTSVSRDDTAAN